MARLQISIRTLLWIMAVLAIALGWRIDRQRLESKLTEAVGTEARLKDRLRASQRMAELFRRKGEAEHAWLRKHHPEVITFDQP